MDRAAEGPRPDRSSVTGIHVEEVRPLGFPVAHVLSRLELRDEAALLEERRTEERIGEIVDLRRVELHPLPGPDGAVRPHPREPDAILDAPQVGDGRVPRISGRNELFRIREEPTDGAYEHVALGEDGSAAVAEE